MKTVEKTLPRACTLWEQERFREVYEVLVTLSDVHRVGKASSFLLVSMASLLGSSCVGFKSSAPRHGAPKLEPKAAVNPVKPVQEESQPSSTLCAPWRTLGERFDLYSYTERKNVLAHQSYVFSVQLPGNATPSSFWLGPSSDSGCPADYDWCGPTQQNLLPGSLDIDLCWEGPLQKVRIDSMHVLPSSEPIEARFASYDIEKQLERCGVGPGVSGYPRVSKDLQIAHEVKYDASKESGWCFTEFENIEPRKRPGESDPLVVFLGSSAFDRTRCYRWALWSWRMKRTLSTSASSW